MFPSEVPKLALSSLTLNCIPSTISLGASSVEGASILTPEESLTQEVLFCAKSALSGSIPKSEPF